MDDSPEVTLEDPLTEGGTLSDPLIDVLGPSMEVSFRHSLGDSLTKTLRNCLGHFWGFFEEIL